MGIKAILRAGQQSLLKEVSLNLSSEPDLSIDASLVNNSLSSTTRTNARGSTWSFTRGTWGILSGKLKASNPSSYPIAVVDALVPNVEINIKDIGQGSGTALWYTDSDNWWGVGVYQDSENCNCTTSYYSCNCTAYSYCTGGYTTCNSGSEQPNGTWAQHYSYQTCGPAYVFNYCSSYGTINYNYTYGYTNTGCTGYSQGSNAVCTTHQNTVIHQNYAFVCNSSTYTCNQWAGGSSCSICASTSCQTCYPAYVRMVRSASATVSTLATYAIDYVARSLRVFVKDKQVTIQPFSDAAGNTSIGSEIIYDASAATETTKFGILISPSSYDEQGSIQDISIKRRY